MIVTSSMEIEISYPCKFIVLTKTCVFNKKKKECIFLEKPLSFYYAIFKITYRRLIPVIDDK